MAEYSQAAPGQPAPSPRNFASMANWAGAAVSLALIVGVGVWGYKLLVRDVSGIPVVRAAEGPMRVAPEDPGGRLADHQGLAVNDVAGTGLAAAPADRLMLAPQPIGLTEEDVPLAAVAEEAPPETVELTALDTGPEDEQATSLSQAATDTPDEIDPIQALADQIAAGVAPLSEVDTADAPPVATELAAVAAPAPDLGPGLARSLRPQVRPSGLRTVALAPAEAAPEGPAELEPESLPAGTRLVQLGAYASPDIARDEWARLEARFGDYMDGKDRVIQRASSGGRVFYRLRAHGFGDLSDARRFCAAFVAENADCIPVVTR
ncbi:SPOR domain-containing protein [Aestuariicoccus sp. MJ-SS9]|uniref:SPOR domain-containing protein n=1 Tax=Aestuariicoccus sp. MJ-SS9 TaxID=3079855 RepID=UPI00290F3DE0|nr:SPOR domain-containing protein [Aestuariicoccus sp. MJ-SS9]MDU8912672.1 SPOR domain-containing protein [Aestuariicoccus sp. MJ-SS9]